MRGFRRPWSSRPLRDAAAAAEDLARMPVDGIAGVSRYRRPAIEVAEPEVRTADALAVRPANGHETATSITLRPRGSGDVHVPDSPDSPDL